MIDENQVDVTPVFALGTRLTKEYGHWRYCRAADALKALEVAYFRPPTRMGIYPPQDLYGHLCATGHEGDVAGVPLVDVRPGAYCWIAEPELG